MADEFVVFDVEGNEVDWYDPHEGHRLLDESTVQVDIGWIEEYLVKIPPGGRFEVRPMISS